ncbi:methyl-accepting chemotaxis protein [Natroniella sulfidigena]|uniref:methyl-accepting chemotaxis protein n=1 Tax=Natroniella sulfidigena TaxID=723921 RepID=UPI002009ED04|nr:methyl-accepting chemotaxis protein [Natroniella sulfidigena]MCK8817179.1 methyl-accepting chemotaxis protein [Natroniella sulfidigena]
MSSEAGLLESILMVAPYLNKFTLEDTGVLVTDTEKVLSYHPGQELIFDIKVGDRIDPNWVVQRALEEERRIVQEKDSSVCGVPYIGISNPIFNDSGQVVGGITISQSTGRKEKLLGVAKGLLEATEVVNKQVEEISIEAEEMVKTGEELNKISGKTEKRVEDTDEIIDIIKNISRQIKMIGMNASIEAARVGDAGKGFTVVAEEVQKLAGKSSSSMSEIEEILTKVSEITEQLDQVAKKIDEVSNKQNNVVTTIHSEVQNLNALGNNVVQMAESLSDDIYQK